MVNFYRTFIHGVVDRRIIYVCFIVTTYVYETDGCGHSGFY